jgi:hypothetical protein
MKKSDSQTFWKNFAKTSWEKKPILAQKFNSPVSEIKEDQIFSMLVEYSDHCRKIKSADGFKFYIDGQIQYQEETLQVLPQKKDKTLQGYNKRMEEIFEDYCLVCDELLQVSQKNSKKLQDFADHLFAHVGFPYRFSEIGLYLGNYRQTPFGVHVDGCGVFSFPVVGKKTFRLWSPEFAKKNPWLDRAHEYKKFKKDSKTMIATPGDMTYWPSSAWHIAESDGSFNATWSLGVWVDRTFHKSLEDAINPLIKSKLGKSGSETLVQVPLQKEGQAITLPANYLKSISTLKNISENEWHDALLKSWLKLKSQGGFKNFPKIKQQPRLSLKSKINLKSAQSILWSTLKSESKMIYAFQGHLIEGKSSKKLVQLIQDLNVGKVCLISDYVDAKDLILLQALAQTGAFALL